MALDPRDGFLRAQEDKATGADPRDGFLRSQEDKAAVGGNDATGALASQNATMAGTGEVERTSSGALVSQDASLSGTALVERKSSGALVSQSATLAGTATVVVPAESIARWLLDEASSGQSPTTAADDTGNGNDLDTIDYDGTNLNWTSVSAGNGLDFSADGHAAIVGLPDIVTNGNIGSELDAATELSFLVRADLINSGSLGNRIFFVGTTDGNGEIALVVQDGSPGFVEVRFNNDAGSNEVSYVDTFPTGLHTWGVTIDTTESAQNDRVKLYKDGVLQTVDSSNVTQNETLENINDTSVNVSIANRGDLDRGAECKVYYVELFKGKLTVAQHVAAHDALVIDNDRDAFATGETSSGALVAQNATMSGTGIREITGTGALASQSATIAGTAEREITAAGALLSQDATLAGEAELEHTSEGTLLSQDATLSGIGEVERTASGALVAQNAILAGTAEREITSSGALTSQNASMAGTAEVEGPITSEGALQSQDATLAGTAVREITSSGALISQNALMAGEAAVGGVTTSEGDLISQAATLAGTAERELTSSGALASQDATLSGTAEIDRTSIGSLISQSATLAGTAFFKWFSSGALIAQNALLSGVAEVEHTATGALLAQNASMTGTGLIGRKSTGALISQNASMTGTATAPIQPTSDLVEHLIQYIVAKAILG